MNAATQWFKFDPSFIGTPMQGEWCLWSFVTKHGRECYSGRWIVSEGADLIVTDRGWSVPLVVSEAYFARVVPFNDKIPEVKYLGSTQNGERFIVEPDIERATVSDDPTNPLVNIPARIRIPSATQTMIEDAGPSSTFVQDKLAEALEPETPRWTLSYRWPTLEAVDFKTPRPGDGPIPVIVTIIAPDGQQFSWDVQGAIKNNALLSPEITPEVWGEICAWQEAWRPA